jgi:parallel beta-helix repeat protein
MLALVTCSGAFATVTIVAPSGNCSTDFANIQNAINSSATGDTVQLAGGNFDLSCLGATGGSLVIPIWHGAITLAGTTLNGVPQTTLSGPGAADPSESTALYVRASGSTVTGLTFRGFFYGVFVRGFGNQGVAVTNCRFEQNIIGIWVGGQAVGTQIVSNVFVVPSAPGAPYTDFDTTIGVGAPRNSNLLIANNTFNGPGVNANFQNPADLLSSNTLEGLGIRSLGIYQLDGRIPASQFGRVSNNTASGFDMAIHASSDFSVISNNTVTNSAVGIMLSNSTGDGVTQVTDGIVTGNIATGNQFGLVLLSAARNVISLNDFTNNSVVGMLFQNNLGGADSEQNRFVLDQGSKAGVAGNQGGFLTWSGPASQP